MVLIEVCVLITIALAVLYYHFTRNYNYWESRGVPAEKPLPPFGNFFDVATGKMSTSKKFEKLYNKFQGPYFGIYMIDKAYLVLKDPDIIKSILIRDFNNFPNRYMACDRNSDYLFSTSLVGIRNPEWRILRSKLSPMFTPGKLKTMFSLMQECANDLHSHLGSVVGQNIEMKGIISRYTTDIIASCAFGVKANSFKSENSEFLTFGRKIYGFTSNRYLQVFGFFFMHKLVSMFKFKFVEASAANFLREVFWEAAKERQANENKIYAIVDMLIDLKNQEAGNDEFEFSGDKVVAQAVIFFTAGFETSSSTIVFTLYELCLNPEIQTQLRDEIKTVINEHGGVTYEAVNEMKYLHMVVSETLRKYSAIPILTRYALEEYTISQTGLVVEKGTPILICQNGLQYDPKYFPEPSKYDPERFNDENKLKIPSCAYLPFGDGPRNCIGDRFGLMVTKLGIIYTIQNFVVTKSSTTPVPLVHDVKTPFLASKTGIPMLLQKL